MVVKICGITEDEANKRYSPAQCIGCEKQVVSGDPDPNLISTSYIERQNLTMRMSMRRFTRLTNGFSKEDRKSHARYCTALHALQLLPHSQDPARHSSNGSGVTKKLWSIEDIVALLD